MSDKINTDWKLQKITLELKEYGKDEGVYTGSVSFSNGERESFRFGIKPDMAAKYIGMVSEEIIAHASILGERLIESLGIKPEDK